MRAHGARNSLWKNDFRQTRGIRTDAEDRPAPDPPPRSSGGDHVAIRARQEVVGTDRESLGQIGQLGLAQGVVDAGAENGLEFQK